MEESIVIDQEFLTYPLRLAKCNGDLNWRNNLIKKEIDPGSKKTSKKKWNKSGDFHPHLPANNL